VPAARTHAELARSFDAAAEVYARARPGYPAVALDWLLPAGATRVLDLGAGTGKLTRLLVDRGLEVTAVEPSDGMRAELARALGQQVRALNGSAERIPLPDRAVDAVLVAQAWHWVDPARAVPEVARVLAPGGRLGLVWNQRDDREPWVAELTRILSEPTIDPDSGSASGTDPSGSRASTERPGIGPPFGSLQRFQTPAWTHELTPGGLVELAASRSYVITLDEPQRSALLGRVRELIARHPDLAGRSRIPLPYVTECLRADLG
jgi:SAM-dependent methyltransferase